MTKQLIWKLPDYLEAHGLTRYQLMQELGDGKGRVAYAWKDLPERLDTDALERVMGALEKLTGAGVRIDDVLEYGPAETADPTAVPLTAAGVPYTGDAETDAVLNDHPDILERIKRLEAGEAQLIPWEQVKAEQRAKRGL